MTHIMRIDELHINSIGIEFPIDAVNKYREKIHIERTIPGPGRAIYEITVDPGQSYKEFHYTTSGFEDALRCARLTIDDVRNLQQK